MDGAGCPDAGAAPPAGDGSIIEKKWWARQGLNL